MAEPPTKPSLIGLILTGSILYSVAGNGGISLVTYHLHKSEQMGPGQRKSKRSKRQVLFALSNFRRLLLYVLYYLFSVQSPKIHSCIAIPILPLPPLLKADPHTEQD
jgi:hypothetical protein